MTRVRKFFDKLITDSGTRNRPAVNYNPYIDKPISQQSLEGKSLRRRGRRRKKTSLVSLSNGNEVEGQDVINENMDQESLTTSSKPYSSLKSASPPLSPVNSIRQSFANANNNVANGMHSTAHTPILPNQNSISSSLELSPIGSASSITSSFNLPTVGHHDGFYSLVKVDKLKFSQRGTLLNFKTREGNGSEVFVCDENGRKIRKRKSRRKRRSVRRRLSLSSQSVREGNGEEEMEEEAVDAVGITRNDSIVRGNGSFVSIATTATTATTLTTTPVNRVEGSLCDPTGIPATTSTHSRSSTTNKQRSSKHLNESNSIPNGKTTDATVPATPYNSPARFGSQFDPCFNINNFKVNIIPDVASYQPSFLKRRNSVRTLESRVATPNTITNTTNTTNNSNGTRVPTESSVASTTSLGAGDVSKSAAASLHHQQVEFGKKFTCVVEEGLKSSSLSAHASIRDVKNEYGFKVGGYDGDRGVAIDDATTDLQSLSSMQLSHYHVDCDEFEENVPLLGKQKQGGGAKGDAEYSETVDMTTSCGEYRDLSSAAQADDGDKYDHKWFIQVKDRLHHYYNAKLIKLKRIKLRNQSSKGEEEEEAGTSEVEKVKQLRNLFQHSVVATSAAAATAAATASTTAAPVAPVATPTTSNSTLNLQSGLYSHQNKRSSKINVVENGTTHKDDKDEFDAAHESQSQSYTVDSDGFYVADETEKEDDLTGAIYFIKNDKEEESNDDYGIGNGNGVRNVPDVVTASLRMSRVLYYHRQQLQRQFKFAPSSLTRGKNKVSGEMATLNGLSHHGHNNGSQVVKPDSSTKLTSMMMMMTPATTTTTMSKLASSKDLQIIELHSPCEAEESSSNDGDDEQSYRGRFDSDVASSIVSLAV
ncbi:hypothetical protein I9W82_004061 [Candida metapsilosis]|uniref:Uncharacterized protein n=1 Tax=Candida metapsilosis TaxID=273372 RepID=A0A8H7ZGB0_9ASCO|nr:hypothetical protein I9W82_004061 [Candida metapsilosis]